MGGLAEEFSTEPSCLVRWGDRFDVHVKRKASFYVMFATAQERQPAAVIASAVMDDFRSCALSRPFCPDEVFADGWCCSVTVSLAGGTAEPATLVFTAVTTTFAVAFCPTALPSLRFRGRSCSCRNLFRIVSPQSCDPCLSGFGNTYMSGPFGIIFKF